MKTLNYISPINSLGYGVVGLNLFMALLRQDVDVKLWPIGQVDAHANFAPFLKEAIDTRHRYHTNAPSLRVWHQHDLAQHVGSGVHIGYPIFELTEFNKVEQEEVKGMDYVFVCSEWAKRVVLDQCSLSSGINDSTVIVIPCGVDRQIFHENVGKPDPKWTTFLNIGKWEYRKGHDILVEAFSKAFEPKDRVRLWMMNHNPFLSEQQTDEWEGMYKSSPMGDSISFLPRVRTHYEVAKVMAEADCGVFPSRAEGWNLELIEMMSMGKQVITTDYSAHTEFCCPGNAHLIEISELETAYDGVFFGDDTVGEWASLGDYQFDRLVDYLRAVHANKTAVNTEGIETAKAFSWDMAAQRILEIDQIWD